MKSIRYFAFGAIIALGFLVGRHFDNTAVYKKYEAPTFVKKSAPLFVGKKVDQSKEPQPHIVTLREIVEQFKGQELYDYLFNRKAFEYTSFKKAMALVQNRFSQSYPKPEFAKDISQQIEEVSRAGILKAFAKSFKWDNLTPEERNEFVNFHKKRAEDSEEKFVVRVQAARNLRTWSSTLSHTTRIKEQSRIPATVLATAAKTEFQLAEEVLSNEK